MEYCVAKLADQFGPIPPKEGSRWLSNLNRMRHSSEANRASMLLIAKGPSQTEKTERNGRSSL